MYESFRQNFKSFPLISLKDIDKTFPSFDSKNLINWQKKGYVLKLRNGYYIIKETVEEEAQLFSIANRLYSPSYISMESALSYYGIIPEVVPNIQSVSTQKTATFSTPLGNFNYRTIKPSIYFGYQLMDYKGITYRMATLEKAILDYLYLRSDIVDYQSIEALRWNKEKLLQVDEAICKDYLRIYNSIILNKKIQTLKSYIYA